MKTVVYKNYDRDDEKTEWIDQKRDELNYWRYGQEEQDYLDTEIEDAWKKKLEQEFEERIEEIESSLSPTETCVGAYRGRFVIGGIAQLLKKFDMNYQDYGTTIYYDGTYEFQIGFGIKAPRIYFAKLTEGDMGLNRIALANGEIDFLFECGYLKEIPYVGGR